MPDLSTLRELDARVVPPDLEGLARVAGRRTRAVASAVAVATGAVAVAVLLVVQPVGSRSTSPDPVAPQPTPTREVGSARLMTPEQIREHPRAKAQGAGPATGAPGVAARTWTVCRAGCEWDTQPPDMTKRQNVLEVTADGYETAALHPLVGQFANVSHAFDDWWVVVDPESARLVNARGESKDLTDGDPTPVEEIDGPLVYGSQGVAWLDLRDGVLHTLDAEDGTWDWWGAGDTWWWGNVYLVGDGGVVTRHGLAWRDADGSFGVRMLPIDSLAHSTPMVAARTPGTMAAVDPGPPRLLHVTTDYGRSWDVRLAPETLTTGLLPDDWRTWASP